MNGKDYDFHNDTGTYQTGRTQPPKQYVGLIAFLIGLVILLSGISTALSIMNLKLYRKLNVVEQESRVSFSRSEELPQPAEALHQQVQSLQEHLGISGTVIPPVYQRYYKLPSGIYVSRVLERSEAQEKGVVVGDIITALDGETVEEDLLDQWASEKKPGDPVQLRLYRAGTEVSLELCWSQFD